MLRQRVKKVKGGYLRISCNKGLINAQSARHSPISRGEKKINRLTCRVCDVSFTHTWKKETLSEAMLDVEIQINRSHYIDLDIILQYKSDACLSI